MVRLNLMVTEMSDERLYILMGMVLLSIFIIVIGVLQTITDVDLLSFRCTLGFVLGYLVNLAVWFLAYRVLSSMEKASEGAS